MRLRLDLTTIVSLLVALFLVFVTFINRSDHPYVYLFGSIMMFLATYFNGRAAWYREETQKCLKGIEETQKSLENWYR